MAFPSLSFVGGAFRAKPDQNAEGQTLLPQKNGMGGVRDDDKLPHSIVRGEWVPRIQSPR